MGAFLSATNIAVANGVLGFLSFMTLYMMPDSMVSNLFNLRKPRDPSLARYLFTFVGQHDVPWTVMSILAAWSGNPSKEYILASFIWSFFVVADVSCRVLNQCEEQGISKSNVAFAIPLQAIVAGASYFVYSQM